MVLGGVRKAAMCYGKDIAKAFVALGGVHKISTCSRLMRKGGFGFRGGEKECGCLFRRG